jgi:hypothetical protein
MFRSLILILKAMHTAHYFVTEPATFPLSSTAVILWWGEIILKDNLMMQSRSLVPVEKNKEEGIGIISPRLLTADFFLSFFKKKKAVYFDIAILSMLSDSGMRYFANN